MPVKETLEAVLRARESVSSALSDIRDAALGAAAAFDSADEAASAFGRELDSAERGAASLAGELGDVQREAAGTAAAAGVADSRVDELGDSLSESAVEAGILAAALSTIPAAGALAGVGGAGMGSASPRTDEFDIDVDTPRVAPDIETRRAVAQIDAPTPTVRPDVETADAQTAITAALDESSFAAATGAIEALPSEHVVDVRADIDGSSFAGAEAVIGSLSEVQQASATIDIETDGEDDLAGLAASGHLAAEGLDALDAAAIDAAAASALAAQEADEAGDAAAGSAAQTGFFAQSLDTLRDATFAAIPGLTAAKMQVDDLGDEATETTAEIGGLTAAMSLIGGTGLGQATGRLIGRLGAIMVVVSALLPIILALGAGLGGLAVAFTSVASIIGAGIFGGLLSLGEEAAATSSEAETALEGVGLVLKDFGEMAQEALAPLRDPIFADLALDFLEGGVELLGQFAQFAADTYREIQPVIDAMGESFWDNSPAFFESMREAAVVLAPVLADLMIYLMENIPAAISYLSRVTSDFAPSMGELATAIMDILPPLIELGGMILSVVGPPLVWLMDVIGGAVSMFNALPEPIQKGMLAAAVAIPILAGLATAIGAVGAAAAAAGGVVALLAGILLSPVVIIGALIGVIVLLIEHFKLWDDIMGALEGTWNFLLDALAGGINLIAGMIEGLVNRFIGLANAAIAAYNLIPGHKDIELIGALDIPEADFSGMKAGGGKLGGMSAGQGGRVAEDNQSGGRGTGGGFGGQGSGGQGGPGGFGGAAASTSSSGTSTRSGTQEFHYHAPADTKNEARQKRIAKDVFHDLMEEKRKSEGGTN